MLITLSIFMPIFLGVVLLFIGNDKQPFYTKLFALISALISLIIVYVVYKNFNIHDANMQLIEKQSLLNILPINYYVGVDGLSIWLILLTAFITPLIIIAGWHVIQKHIATYYACFLILSGLTIGAFTALDGVLFYIFFEATLIPMYLVIGIWGGVRRVYAAFKFFLYTLLGSLLCLLAIIYLFNKTQNFDVLVWHNIHLSMTEQIYLFIAFALAFAVKIPMWPVHTWLPDAHVEAPTGGSMLLAAIMLKLGAYGFLRFAMPINPDASHVLAPYIIGLSLIAIIYVGLIALVQTDMKKLVAYSSISHMGFVTLGLFIFSDWGMSGALVQMISHGFISAAMFYCIGVLYDRVHSRNIADYGGIVQVMPRFAVFALFFAMANSGLPATSGFVGEFMVIIGAVKYNFWIGLLAAMTLIMGAAYSLWMYKRVVFGQIVHQYITELKDIGFREFAVLAILASATLFMGLYPKYFTDSMMPAITNLLEHMTHSKL
jgi:NADH-quinone oxidoreductase subunit M